jgi:hypothetical protein
MSDTRTTTALERLLVLFLVTSLLALSACGGGAAKSDDDDDEEPSPVVFFDVTGIVEGNDGGVIADAAVTARAADGTNAILDAVLTNAGGQYSLRVAGATEYYLHVTKPAYATTNSHVRKVTGTTLGADLVMLLQIQADTLLLTLGGPANFTSGTVLYIARALDAFGDERENIELGVSPGGLLSGYRLADDSGYMPAGPTPLCTAGGGCTLPQMAGWNTAGSLGVYVFRFAFGGGSSFAALAATLTPGEVTYVVTS